MAAWVVNRGAVTRKTRVSLARFVCTDSQPRVPISGDKNVFSLLVPRGHLSHGSFISHFQEEKEGQGALLIAVISQLPLIQNNQHARVAYFGVTCSERLHD